MNTAQFLSLGGFGWLTVLIVLLTAVLLADAFAGHYRSGFENKSQFAPFLSGGLLIIAALLALILPFNGWMNTLLQIAGWVAIASGIIGFGFHHIYGIVKKPAGYGWLLHYLMYGAPQLAPLGLSANGILALIAARGLAKETEIYGFDLRAALLVFVAVSLFGAILQAGILHYRGAFNNPLMYLPLTVPLAVVFAAVWAVLLPNSIAFLLLEIFLWLTFLTGFIGLGMHLRGFDRQMGGLYIAIFNWMEGPPAFAPALFAGFAAVGLVTIYLF
ncbi:MAG: hypothetical protein ACR2L1_10065 [Pyrinomonadaceae bacterium]